MDLNRLLRLAKLCGEPEALEEAKVVHEWIIALVSASDVSSRNVIIEMYSGCGSFVDARKVFDEMLLKSSETWCVMMRCFANSGFGDDALKVFDEMTVKDSETWCVMMRCFINNGYGEKAIDLFTRFKEEGNKPNGEIFKEVFSACTLIGDVTEGSMQFEAMQRDYGIIPSMEHYHSFTKILATSALLDEAISFVEIIPMEPSVDMWETLMNLSRVHGDLELGDRCAELVEKLDATRLDKVSSAGLVSTKEEPNYRSKPRYNLGTKDTSQPEMDTIYDTLKILQSQMLEMGYDDLETFQLPSRHEAVEKENKERIFGYREEVAVVKGLLNSKPRSSVTVITNMRICADCHDALKLISVITGRVLIKRYHFFENSVCSCNDYW